MMNAERRALGKARQQQRGVAELRPDYSYGPDDPLVDLKAKLYYVDNRNEQSTLTRGTAAGYDVTYQTDTYGLQLQNTSTLALLDRAGLKANYGLEYFLDKVRPDSTQATAASSAVDYPVSEGMTPRASALWAACSATSNSTTTTG